MNYLVLYIRPFSFKDDQGKQLEGATVHYLDPQALPLEGEVGCPPFQATVSLEASKGFQKAPAFYDLDFRKRRTSKGKQEAVLVGGKYLADFSFEAVN